MKFATLVVITIAASAVNLVLISGDHRPPPWDYADLSFKIAGILLRLEKRVALTVHEHI